MIHSRSAPWAAVQPRNPLPTGKTRPSETRESPTFPSNPILFVVASARSGLFIGKRRLSRSPALRIVVHRSHGPSTSCSSPDHRRAYRPILLDGEPSDRAWRNIHPFSVITNRRQVFRRQGNRDRYPRGATTHLGVFSCSHGRIRRVRSASAAIRRSTDGTCFTMDRDGTRT